MKTASGAAVTIRPIDWFRRTAPEKTLQGFRKGGDKPEWGEWEQPYGLQSFVEPYEGRFYYVKNFELRKKTPKEYERFEWDDNYISLERDTGWDGPDVLNSFDPDPGSRRYAHTDQQSSGEQVHYYTTIRGWDDGRGYPDAKCSYMYSDEYDQNMVLTYHPTKDFGGDLKVREAISIEQFDDTGGGHTDANRLETFWYVRDYGWVQFDDNKAPENSVRWNKWKNVEIDPVKPGDPKQPLHPEIPLEPDTTPCPPFMKNDPHDHPADVSEYLFVDEPNGRLVAGPPTDWVAGQTRTYTLKLKNMGAETWMSDGADSVRLGVHFGGASDAPGEGWATNQSFSLPMPEYAAVGSGASVYVTVKVTAPSQPGTYTLRHRLVRGDNQWFYQIHKTTAEVRLPAVRASVADNGAEGQGSSSQPSISSATAEGYRVAFTSWAANLVPYDRNRSDDAFRHLLPVIPFRPVTDRASVRNSGWEGHCPSTEPSISANGKRVAFTSIDLASDDTNQSADIYVHDFDTHTTRRVSVGLGGVQANGSSFSPAISADGNRVAFYSEAANLLGPGGDTNGKEDVFVHDLNSGTTFRVSVGTNGEQANDKSYLRPSISADGSRVAFTSAATNLLGPGGDTNGKEDVFVHDLNSHTTLRASVDKDGHQSRTHSAYPSLSADGTRVAFNSYGILVSEDTNAKNDVYIHDFTTAETIRVSVGTNDEQGNDHSYYPSISADGTRVAFTSAATNLFGTDSDTNGKEDIFVRDLTNEWTFRASVGNGQANGHSSTPSLSGDGTRVAFTSQATNIVADDSNNLPDVFVVPLPEQ